VWFERKRKTILLDFRARAGSNNVSLSFLILIGLEGYKLI
jgi:hypothetical protein